MQKVKEFLKSANIWQSYERIIRHRWSFLTHSVVLYHIYSELEIISIKSCIPNEISYLNLVVASSKLRVMLIFTYFLRCSNKFWFRYIGIKRCIKVYSLILKIASETDTIF